MTNSEKDVMIAHVIQLLEGVITTAQLLNIHIYGPAGSTPNLTICAKFTQAGLSAIALKNALTHEVKP